MKLYVPKETVDYNTSFYSKNIRFEKIGTKHMEIFLLYDSV